MNALTIFLNALERALSYKRGFFVPKRALLDCRFPAYKRLVVEVWCVDGDYQTLISKVDISERYATSEEQQSLEKKVVEETIKNILGYYGI